MICFGNRTPLIRMSAPTHKSLLVRNVVLMLSYWVVSWARLQGHPMIWSLALCPDHAKQEIVVRRGFWRSSSGKGSTYCIHIHSRDSITSTYTRDGTTKPVSRDQILRRERGQENIHFPFSVNHEEDWHPYTVDPYSVSSDYQI